MPNKILPQNQVYLVNILCFQPRHKYTAILQAGKTVARFVNVLVVVYE